MTPEEIKAARERCEGTTTAPWRALLNSKGMTGVHGPDVKIYHAKFDPVCLRETDERMLADANFIAHARTDLPRALDEIGRLSARVSEITGENNEFWSATWCPECGPDVKVDEDGCCTMCGCVAMGIGVECVGFMSRERDQLRSDIEDLQEQMSDFEHYRHRVIELLEENERLRTELNQPTQESQEQIEHWQKCAREME